MNYIKEINAFYDWLETNSISTSAIVLWHALMAINNKCGWIPEFTVATSVLEVKTGLNRRTIERARNELKQKNRINWNSRKGNQSALYKLVRFYDAQTVVQDVVDKTLVRQEAISFDAQYVAQDDAQYVAQDDAQPVAINKLNKTKLNETKLSLNLDVDVEPNNIWDSFFKAFGKHPTPIQIEKINSFIDQDGLSVDLVCFGLLKTGERGMPFNYAESTFKSWKKKNILTYQQALEEQKAYKQGISSPERQWAETNKANRPSPVTGEGKDILYDWLNVSNE
ncbi:DnaD domain protein [Schinkia sp. CFF1]